MMETVRDLKPLATNELITKQMLRDAINKRILNGDSNRKEEAAIDVLFAGINGEYGERNRRPFLALALRYGFSEDFEAKGQVNITQNNFLNLPYAERLKAFQDLQELEQKALGPVIEGELVDANPTEG